MCNCLGPCRCQGWPIQIFLGLAHVIRTQRRTVRLVAVLLRRAVADMRAYQEQRRRDSLPDHP